MKRLGARNIISRIVVDRWEKIRIVPKGKARLRSFLLEGIKLRDFGEEAKPTVSTSLDQYWHSRLPKLASPERG
jgi:hypothetical protein